MSGHRIRQSSSDTSESKHIHKVTEQHPTRYYSSKQEKAVAKAFNGKRQPNSGATTFKKGDVVSDQWLYECKTKTTNSNSISVKKEWIEKNKQEALFIGKPYSCVVINFGPGQENYYIIDEQLMQSLVEYLQTHGSQ